MTTSQGHANCTDEAPSQEDGLSAGGAVAETEEASAAQDPQPVNRYTLQPFFILRLRNGVVKAYQEESTIFLRAPYDEAFREALREAIPRKNCQFHKDLTSHGFRFEKAWVFNNAYWPTVEGLLHEHYGVGNLAGAYAWLGVDPRAPDAVVATAYFCGQTKPERDEVSDHMYETAIRTLENEGRRLAPPYGPGGFSQSEGSLLEFPTTAFDLPPNLVAHADAALHGLRRALRFKDEFDSAWKKLAQTVSTHEGHENPEKPDGSSSSISSQPES